MELTRNSSSGALEISGSLDIGTAPSLREALADALSHNATLSIDLAAVSDCDTAGLQVLLSAQRTVERAGGALHITAISEAVAHSAEFLGFSLPLAGPSA